MVEIIFIPTSFLQSLSPLHLFYYFLFYIFLILPWLCRRFSTGQCIDLLKVCYSNKYKGSQNWVLGMGSLLRNLFYGNNKKTLWLLQCDIYLSNFPIRKGLEIWPPLIVSIKPNCTSCLDDECPFLLLSSGCRVGSELLIHCKFCFFYLCNVGVKSYILFPDTKHIIIFSLHLQFFLILYVNNF